MYINKKEQALLAYFLELNLDECEVKETKITMLKTLKKIYENGVLEHPKLYKED
jgi:hypothetical protein